jgi:hypothetical protein
VSAAYIWHSFAVAALNMVVLKFCHAGAQAAVIGMNTASETIVDKLALHGKSGAAAPLLLHERGAKGGLTQETGGGDPTGFRIQLAGNVNFLLMRPYQAIDKNR